MQSRSKRAFVLVPAAMVVSALCFVSIMPAAGMQNSTGYIQHNLVSNLPNTAIATDPNLKNPWGIAFSPTGPFWISDNGTGVSTVYNGQAHQIPSSQSPLVVTIPPPSGSTDPAAPTGIVFNGSQDFLVSTPGGKPAPAVFIFATEDGTISGWNPSVSPTTAILASDQSSLGAVYKGLAITNGGSGSRLFATDFHNNAVRVFDGQFNQVGSFTDSALPPGFAPFGIVNIQGLLYVSFALQKPPDNEDDQKGPGNGFVDVFSTAGQLMRRLVSGGELNSPWGMAFAANFGEFSNALLVGNFGDGEINAYDISTGAFMGKLTNQIGQPIMIDGLWGLIFGNGGQGGNSAVLYFTAGPNDENDGLFGDLQPAQSNGGIINP